MSGKGKKSIFEKAADAVDHALHPEETAPQEEASSPKPAEEVKAVEPKKQSSKPHDGLVGHRKFSKFNK